MSMVIFPLGPGAADTEGLSDQVRRLWTAHDKEAEDKGAQFCNYGWVTSNDAICSKTTRGNS
jgi:hypothetical protein